jgi:hypothetical protein
MPSKNSSSMPGPDRTTSTGVFGFGVDERDDSRALDEVVVGDSGSEALLPECLDQVVWRACTEIDGDIDVFREADCAMQNCGLSPE